LFISINSYVKLFADSNPVPGRDVGLLLNQRQTLPGRSFDGSPHPTQRLLEGLCQHGPTQSRRQENKQPTASSLYRQIAEGSNDWRRPHDNVPGVITAGTFYQDCRRVFWDVHDPEKTVTIDLHHERYSQLIVEVADPDAAIKLIQSAL